MMRSFWLFLSTVLFASSSFAMELPGPNIDISTLQSTLNGLQRTLGQLQADLPKLKKGGVVPPKVVSFEQKLDKAGIPRKQLDGKDTTYRSYAIKLNTGKSVTINGPMYSNYVGGVNVGMNEIGTDNPAKNVVDSGPLTQVNEASWHFFSLLDNNTDRKLRLDDEATIRALEATIAKIVTDPRKLLNDLEKLNQKYLYFPVLYILANNNKVTLDNFDTVFKKAVNNNYFLPGNKTENIQAIEKRAGRKIDTPVTGSTTGGPNPNPGPGKPGPKTGSGQSATVATGKDLKDTLSFFLKKDEITEISLIGTYDKNKNVYIRNGNKLELNFDSNEIVLKANTFEGFDNVTQIGLSYKAINQIDPGAFNGCNKVQTLSMQYANLSAIHDNAFSGLSGLQYLNLSNNGLTKVPKGLPNSLSILDLSNNKIVDLEESNFSNLGSLENLKLFANNIKRFKNGVLSKLTNLKELDIAYQRETFIEAGAFNGLNNCTKLILYNNQLNQLVSGTFEGLPKLINLSLKSEYNNKTVCTIKNIKANAFKGLEHFKKLDLSGLKIENIEANAFVDLNSLTQLNIANNKLSEIKKDTFNGLKSVTKLILRDNEGNSAGTFKNLVKGGFNGLSSLISLDLSRFGIEGIQAGAFNGLDNCTELALYENSLNTLVTGTFEGLPKLINLSLKSGYVNKKVCTIKTIQSNAFKGLEHFTELDLSDLKIENIEANAFVDLKSLTKLNISDNPLKTLVSDTFAGLRLLTSFVKPIRVQYVKSKAFNGLHNLPLLDIYSNDFDNRAFVGLNSINKLVIGTPGFSSDAVPLAISADFLEGLGSLEVLDIRNINDKSTIADNAFTNLKNLKILKVPANGNWQTHIIGNKENRLKYSLDNSVKIQDTF